MTDTRAQVLALRIARSGGVWSSADVTELANLVLRHSMCVCGEPLSAHARKGEHDEGIAGPCLKHGSVCRGYRGAP